MRDLEIEFRGNAITGSGTDIVAPFTLSGRLREDGTVEIVKRYRHRHSVLYVGIYDGEGNFNGRWDIGGHQGEWSIRILKPQSGSLEDIQEIE